MNRLLPLRESTAGGAPGAGGSFWPVSERDARAGGIMERQPLRAREHRLSRPSPPSGALSRAVSVTLGEADWSAGRYDTSPLGGVLGGVFARPCVVSHAVSRAACYPPCGRLTVSPRSAGLVGYRAEAKTRPSAGGGRGLAEAARGALGGTAHAVAGPVPAGDAEVTRGRWSLVRRSRRRGLEARACASCRSPVARLCDPAWIGLLGSFGRPTASP